MIKIENTDVHGFEAALRGMRNPYNSWNKSDSEWELKLDEDREMCENGEHIAQYFYKDKYEIGKNDLKLAQSLSKAGTDHSKFLRMINVTCDITAPLYFYKEFDTYKIGTVCNSCSTMHRIHVKEFTLDDFSYEHLFSVHDFLMPIIKALNMYREEFLKTKDKVYWWQMIQLLPSSYNQKRTMQFNYQVLKNIYFARRHHKLDEWRQFCTWCETLPYFREICIGPMTTNDFKEN